MALRPNLLLTVYRNTLYIICVDVDVCLFVLGPVDGVTADQSKYWPGVPTTIIIITSPSIRTRSSLIRLTLHSLSLCPRLRSGRGKNQRYGFLILSLLTLFICVNDFTDGEGKH